MPLSACWLNLRLVAVSKKIFFFFFRSFSNPNRLPPPPTVADLLSFFFILLVAFAGDEEVPVAAVVAAAGDGSDEVPSMFEERFEDWMAIPGNEAIYEASCENIDEAAYELQLSKLA
jgi:hypothetical protein